MNKYKLSSLLYYISALCWYIAAFISFTNESRSRGVIWLCLGSAMLGLGSVFLNKYRKEKNNDKSDDEKDRQ